MSTAVERLAARLGLGGDFYVDVVRRLVADGTLRPDMHVLVVCGGEHDRDALLQCGLRDVTISNLDTRLRGDEFAPYAWSFQDAERLAFADDAFDVVIVHNGLHHCHSPHRALCETYRVARVGVLVFEPYDGPLARLAVRLGFGQDYEVAAVFDNDMAFGGVGNSAIPNHVYRWTEAEVRKTIRSYAPVGHHRFTFHYALRVPWGRLRMLRGRLRLAATAAALPLLKLATLVAPRLCNNFAFVVLKPRLPGDLLPWLRLENGAVTLDRAWVGERYAKE
jgi:SAM-dependent methyltransferase